MGKTRAAYPPEFRRQMVELVRAGRSPEELAREFEPTAQSIRNWLAQSERNTGQGDGGLTTAEREELNRLRRENRQLRLEREILSKAAAWFARETNTIPQGRVPVGERSPGGLSDCQHVSAAGCLLQWLLCVDEAAAVAACRDRCGVDRRNPCGACGLARPLRCAAHPCRVDGQGNARRPQARRSADVADRPCRCEPTQVRCHHGQERQPSGTRPGGTRLHRVSA